VVPEVSAVVPEPAVAPLPAVVPEVPAVVPEVPAVAPLPAVVPEVPAVVPEPTYADCMTKVIQAEFDRSVLAWRSEHNIAEHLKLPAELLDQMSDEVLANAADAQQQLPHTLQEPIAGAADDGVAADDEESSGESEDPVDGVAADDEESSGESEDPVDLD
jgi:hypothetical protein